MNKAVVASLLLVASFAPQISKTAFGQTQPDAASGAQAGQVQMSAAEYAAYNSAIGQTTPQTKAPALESYLTAYPQSAVKADVLQQLMLAYSSFDAAKTIATADRLLQVDPNNVRALTFEVYFRKQSADALTDPTAKQAALDSAASFAQKGLAATKPKDMSDADFKTVMASATPIFYSAIATAALNKKDTATAITNYKAELASVPVDQTTKPGPILQDTYFLGLAYLQSTPPDLVNCSFYVARFVAFAPEPYKSQMLPTAQYCYKKFHGNADGYDQVAAAAQANLNPPSTLTVTPAPKPADIVAQTIASTPDLGTLALSDKEFILANGKPEDADKVWQTVKGKSVEIPGAVVIESTPTTLKVAVSDDAVQSKTADFTFNLKPVEAPEHATAAANAAAKKKADAIAAATAVGQKVTLTGTYDSYTPNPLMITMSDGEVVLPKAAAAPVHHHAATH
jgi:predicted house-cleaning NTP pyrophosphatase (Maf/HAM1 superfamily)